MEMAPQSIENVRFGDGYVTAMGAPKPMTRMAA
jgi:hypothetical protein